MPSKPIDTAYSDMKARVENGQLKETPQFESNNRLWLRQSRPVA
jgi:hypothetical protein